MDIYGIDGRFSIDIWLSLLGLPLLILRAVILIIFGCKFSLYLAVEGGKFDLGMIIQDNAADE
ncbi:MAG: hypothetical protein K2K98_10230 [Muribaculaceae bacterium]|nr:hypothetical protein [Muribaculaceae bacterium]